MIATPCQTCEEPIEGKHCGVGPHAGPFCMDCAVGISNGLRELAKNGVIGELQAPPAADNQSKNEDA